MHIHTIETPSLGDRSYVVDDGEVAVVIDPQRDLDRVLHAVDERGVQVSHVFETHVHNDYVTGGYELARLTGATYCLNRDEELFFDFHGLADGDAVRTGRLRVRVVHTPGHTPTHLSYVVDDGTDEAVFTGGSLLYGSVGRTDLVSGALAEQLTRQQHASVRRLAETLDDDVTVLPTHGFGSFCSSAAPDEDTSRVDPALGVETSTIGEQAKVNLALTITDEDAFVETLLSGLDAYPRYYVHMGPRNRVGPVGVDLSPPTEADPIELSRRIHSGEWVVDLRSRTAFAERHVLGTVNIEVGDQFVTYLAWLLPWGMPVTLVGDGAEEVARAQRDMVRVGIERPAARAIGGVQRYGEGLDLARYPVASAEELAARRRAGDEVHVLDVRRHDERERLAAPGSQHIPIHELERRMHEVPADREVWVHCASGYRSSIAASLLERGGRRPVLLDDSDERIAAVPTGAGEEST